MDGFLCPNDAVGTGDDQAMKAPADGSHEPFPNA
jgi:hypothetical protein